MKIFFILFIVMSFNMVCFAAQPVKLTMEIKLNGELSHPIIVTNFGEMASVSMIEDNGNGYEISLLPSEIQDNGKNAVKIEMEVSKIVNKVATKVSSPKVVTLIGETATINQSGNDSLTLSITPTL